MILKINALIYTMSANGTISAMYSETVHTSSRKVIIVVDFILCTSRNKRFLLIFTIINMKVFINSAWHDDTCASYSCLSRVHTP